MTAKVASSGSNIASSGAKVASSGSNIASSGAKVASSDSNIASSGAKVASSGAKVASSESNIASSEDNIVSSESNIASSEPNIASARVKQRMSYQNLKTLICSVCSEWLSLDQLSAIVRRDKIYLRNFISPKMLEDNSLEMLFPGIPNHPRQKYKSTVKK